MKDEMKNARAANTGVSESISKSCNSDSSANTPRNQGAYVSIGVVAQRVITIAGERMRARAKFARAARKAEMRGPDWGQQGFRDRSPEEARVARAAAFERGDVE